MCRAAFFVLAQPPATSAWSYCVIGNCAPIGLRYTARVIRNIIFDWSGTLVDDLPAVWQAIRKS